jgi:uncharacterized protein
VRDDPAHSRLEAVLSDGEVTGYAHYQPGEDAHVFDHTVVGDAYEGRGIGSALAEGVVDHAREHGLRVVPTCSFLRAWLARHPEAHDVLADGVDLH